MIQNTNDIDCVYIAGPISPRINHDLFEFLDNIKLGNQLAVEAMKEGFAVFSPFLDYQFILFNQGPTSDFNHHMFYKSSMKWLERSDAVLVRAPYLHSRGTVMEIARAEKLNIPVFYDLEDLLWYRETIKDVPLG